MDKWTAIVLLVIRAIREIKDIFSNEEPQLTRSNDDLKDEILKEIDRL